LAERVPEKSQYMKLGSLIARIVIGGLFFGHGTQKLFGWFGGHGPEGTGQFFESLGLQPGKANAYAAGAAEAGGGLLLIAGGRAAALGNAAISGSMATAIRHVHLAKGPWSTDGGYEYNLVLMAATLALAEEEAGTSWALASLAAGIGGSLATTELAKRRAAAEKGRDDEQAEVAVPFERAEQTAAEQTQPA
jgi:putative oxidoreductase